MSDTKILRGEQHALYREAYNRVYEVCGGGIMAIPPAMNAGWEAVHAAQAKRIEELERDRKRLYWVLNQLCPSMFADHGIAALREVAAQMRNGRSGGQAIRGIAAIDAARQRISELEDNAARLEGRMGTALNRIRELEDEPQS